METRRRANARSPLLSLPVEIRERIYSYCFTSKVIDAQRKRDAQTTRHTPLDQPLLTVCKAIRSEALPFCYGRYELHIQTFIRCSYHGQVWLRTDKWYQSIPTYKLQHIAKFRLHFPLIDRYTGERVPIFFDIILDKRSATYELQDAFARSWWLNPHRTGDPADFADLIEVMRKHLSSVLDQLIDDPGIGNWSAEALELLVKIDPDSLPLQTMAYPDPSSTHTQSWLDSET